MIQVGKFNTLRALRQSAYGMYLDDGANGILLPNRFVPSTLQIGDAIDVFIYHDGEERLVATTQTPKGTAGDIVKLKAVNVNPNGTFLDNGLMKDLFVPRSQQLSGMRVYGEYLVKLFIDEQTGRLTATEKINPYISNEALTVKEGEAVQLIVWRRTDMGYAVIINNLHEGLLHHNELFSSIQVGDACNGFIKKIFEDNRIDVAIGKKGYDKVEGETDKIIRLLTESNGFLPYHDKSNPDDIYDVFGMSKKTFKMALGNLYKQRKINIENNGIKLM